MRISVQSQVVVLISLLAGCSIFSILGWRYFALQEQQDQLFSMSQSVSAMEHADTMQMQWLTTLDLFLSDQQSYLVSGIQSQTAQLEEQYQLIEPSLGDSEHKTWLAEMKTHLKKVEQGVTQLAYAQSTTDAQWQNLVLDSDESTGLLLELRDQLADAMEQALSDSQQRVAQSEQQLVQLAWVLILAYLVVNVLLGVWNANTIVKPLQALARRTSEEECALKLDTGPDEIRSLSQSLDDFACALTQQQLETKNLYQAGEITRQWLTVLMNSVPVAIISTDSQLDILSVNNAGIRLFGESEAKLKGSRLSHYLKELESLCQSQLDEREFPYVKEDKTRYLEVSSEELNFQGDKQKLFIIRDITRRKTAEQREKSLNRQLVHSEKLASVGQLAAGVAHEINNPMGFVKANVKVMQDAMRQLNQYIQAVQAVCAGQAELNSVAALQHSLQQLQQQYRELDIEYISDDLQDLLDSSLSGVTRVIKIAADMKAFAHIDDEQTQAENVNQLIELAIEEVKRDFPHVQVSCELQSIPFVQCWPQRLNQVWVNLLVNACQATETQGKIQVKTRAQASSILVEVLDSGCGMDKETLDKAFDPFFTTKPVGTGTGLGLHISHSIVEKHAGNITLDSIKGKGSRVSVSLPLS